MDEMALFSDVHGNSWALRAVLAEIERRGIVRRYCLGDLVGYGADPNGVVGLVRDSGIPSLLGNYDEGVGWEKGGCGCFYPDQEAKQVGEASYSFTVATVTSENKAWLRDLPRELHVTLGENRVHLVHGSPRRINEYLLRDRDERTYIRLAASETDDILAFGHTHQLWQGRFGHVLFVNVGTVGRPKDGDSRAGFAVLAVSGTDVSVEWVRVEYDVEEAARATIMAGLPVSLAEGLRAGP